jgi:hypothetical protein
VFKLLSNHNSNTILIKFLSRLQESASSIYYHDPDHPCAVKRALIALDRSESFSLANLADHLVECGYSTLASQLKESLTPS